MREFLIDTITHMPAAPALEGLLTEEAESRVPGTNHSIAEIVAHLDFWLNWFCERCEGIHEPIVETAASGWPAVERGSWPSVRDRFLASLERAAAIPEHKPLDTPLAPPIEFPPLAHYTIRDAVVHMSVHTAHHVGQIILLRQLMGVWPPPSGSYTW